MLTPRNDKIRHLLLDVCAGHEVLLIGFTETRSNVDSVMERRGPSEETHSHSPPPLRQEH